MLAEEQKKKKDDTKKLTFRIFFLLRQRIDHECKFKIDRLGEYLKK